MRASVSAGAMPDERADGWLKYFEATRGRPTRMTRQRRGAEYRDALSGKSLTPLSTSVFLRRSSKGFVEPGTTSIEHMKMQEHIEALQIKSSFMSRFDEI